MQLRTAGIFPSAFAAHPLHRIQPALIELLAMGFDAQIEVWDDAAFGQATTVDFIIPSEIVA